MCFSNRGAAYDRSAISATLEPKCWRVFAFGSRPTAEGTLRDDDVLERAMTTVLHKIAFAILGCLVLAACGGGGGGATSPPSGTFSAKSGVAQKGPLIKGSIVTAQELDANLSPTGKQYSYQISSDLGTFSPTSTFGSQYIGLNAIGYYFDEVQNAVSTGTVILNGYSDLALNTTLNVNLMTTLAYQRIQVLVTKSGMTFSAARTQAENEVLTALNIPAASYSPFDTLDLSGSSDGDHILAAISSIFVNGNSAGPLSQLIDDFQSDIGANGIITNAKTTAALAAAAAAIDPTAVAANLTQEYASEGLTFTASNISDWIAQSGDGVIGKFAFQVADATLSSVFTFPSFVVSQFAGTSVTVSAGQLSVNGMPASGAVTFNAGDVVTLARSSGDPTNGVFNCYLVSGSKKVARVSFVSGLLSIAVTPNAPGVPFFLTEQFTATGTFSDTSTANLTGSVTWTSGTPTVASVISNTGFANTFEVGSTVITATLGSVSGSTTLTVTPAALESIAIKPNPVTTGVGIHLQLTAMGTYSDGTTQSVTVASWTSDKPSVATIGATTGVVTGVSTGSATISANIGAVTGTAPLSIVANAWFPTGQMTSGRSEHTATLLTNGTVLAAGGAAEYPPNMTAITSSAEIYDSQAETWTLTGSMTTARGNHTATLLPNDTVLAAGGFEPFPSPAPVNPSAEIYDPVAGTWSLTATMTTPRAQHTATLLPNGTVLVAGGATSMYGSGGPALASAEIYNPTAGTWTPTGNMTTARYLHTATLLPNGTVLVAGGSQTIPNGTGAGGSPIATAEIYDPTTGTWSTTGSMSTARGNHTATLLPNGTVLVAGGGVESSTSYTTVASAEIYNPTTGTWSSTGSMSTLRAWHTATLMPNGTVLVAGGGDPDGNVSSNSAELYDSVAGTWTLTGSLTTARAQHTATLLPNGTVLAAGGGNPGSGTALIAETYDTLLH
jgi:hypothetical protein